MSILPERERRLEFVVAFILAALLQGALLSLLDFGPSTPQVATTPEPVFVEFVTLPPPPIQDEPAAQDVPDDVLEQPIEEVDPSPREAVASTPFAPPLPSLNLPTPDGPSSASEAAAALRNYFCIEVDGDEVATGNECGAVHVARPGFAEVGETNETQLAQDIAARRASALGLGLAPNQIAPVADVVTDPYAPNDFTFTNPVDDLRGEIF